MQLPPRPDPRKLYDKRFLAERARWKPIVAAGGVNCAARKCLHPTRAIAPGEPWDLDHQAGLRPSHRRCNRAAGAHNALLVQAANRLARHAAATTVIGRAWTA